MDKPRRITTARGEHWPLRHVLSATGPGWRALVLSLIRDLFKLGWDGSLSQTKEKFGGLRFYIGGGTTEIFDRIEKAEDIAEATCEHCGRVGTLRGDGWLVTMCRYCWRRAQYVKKMDDYHNDKIRELETKIRDLKDEIMVAGERDA